MIRLVLADTNALISMLCFPSGKPTLASEVFQASLEDDLELLIADVVAQELRNVVRRDFAAFEASLETFLERFTNLELPAPSEALLYRSRALCQDPNDVTIAAAAVQCAELHGVEYLLTNDFQNFHTPEMKAFLLEHEMVPVSLYGLLRLLGKRP